MNNKIKEKIIKVNKEHLNLLSLAKENLENSNNDNQNYTENILNTIKEDNKNIKKYEACLKAQNLIQNLTEQILNSNSPEEIALLRKKINYNINKIKEELARRNTPKEEIDNYNTEVSYLRKSIALYIRFLKREDNLQKINELSINMDNLNKDDLNNLKKCLQKENRYNQRYLREFNKETINEEEKNSSSEKEIIFTDEDVEIIPAEIVPNVDLPVPFYVIPKEKPKAKAIKPHVTDYSIKKVTADVTYEETSKYFNDVLNSYHNRFDLIETLDYSKEHNLPQNTINFLKNIPRYLHNKKVIEKMERDSFMYYSGDDFTSFIACMKERNSISNALKYLFKDSSLSLKEKEFLVNHENCARWMYEYCLERNATVFVKN